MASTRTDFTNVFQPIDILGMPLDQLCATAWPLLPTTVKNPIMAKSLYTAPPPPQSDDPVGIILPATGGDSGLESGRRTSQEEIDAVGVSVITAASPTGTAGGGLNNAKAPSAASTAKTIIESAIKDEQLHGTPSLSVGVLHSLLLRRLIAAQLHNINAYHDSIKADVGTVNISTEESESQKPPTAVEVVSTVGGKSGPQKPNLAVDALAELDSKKDKDSLWLHIATLLEPSMNATTVAAVLSAGNTGDVPKGTVIEKAIGISNKNTKQASSKAAAAAEAAVTRSAAQTAVLYSDALCSQITFLIQSIQLRDKSQSQEVVEKNIPLLLTVAVAIAALSYKNEGAREALCHLIEGISGTIVGDAANPAPQQNSPHLDVTIAKVLTPILHVLSFVVPMWTTSAERLAVVLIALGKKGPFDVRNDLESKMTEVTFFEKVRVEKVCEGLNQTFLESVSMPYAKRMSVTFSRIPTGLLGASTLKCFHSKDSTGTVTQIPLTPEGETVSDLAPGTIVLNVATTKAGSEEGGMNRPSGSDTFSFGNLFGEATAENANNASSTARSPTPPPPVEPVPAPVLSVTVKGEVVVSIEVSWQSEAKKALAIALTSLAARLLGVSEDAVGSATSGLESIATGESLSGWADVSLGAYSPTSATATYSLATRKACLSLGRGGLISSQKQYQPNHDTNENMSAGLQLLTMDEKDLLKRVKCRASDLSRVRALMSIVVHHLFGYVPLADIWARDEWKEALRRMMITAPSSSATSTAATNATDIDFCPSQLADFITSSVVPLYQTPFKSTMSPASIVDAATEMIKQQLKAESARTLMNQRLVLGQQHITGLEALEAAIPQWPQQTETRPAIAILRKYLLADTANALASLGNVPSSPVVSSSAGAFMFGAATSSSSSTTHYLVRTHGCGEVYENTIRAKVHALIVKVFAVMRVVKRQLDRSQHRAAHRYLRAETTEGGLILSALSLLACPLDRTDLAAMCKESGSGTAAVTPTRRDVFDNFSELLPIFSDFSRSSSFTISSVDEERNANTTLANFLDLWQQKIGHKNSFSATGQRASVVSQEFASLGDGGGRGRAAVATSRPPMVSVAPIVGGSRVFGYAEIRFQALPNSHIRVGLVPTNDLKVAAATENSTFVYNSVGKFNGPIPLTPAEEAAFVRRYPTLGGELGVPMRPGRDVLSVLVVANGRNEHVVEYALNSIPMYRYITSAATPKFLVIYLTAGITNLNVRFDGPFEGNVGWRHPCAFHAPTSHYISIVALAVLNLLMRRCSPILEAQTSGAGALVPNTTNTIPSATGAPTMTSALASLDLTQLRNIRSLLSRGEESLSDMLHNVLESVKALAIDDPIASPSSDDTVKPSAMTDAATRVKMFAAENIYSHVLHQLLCCAKVTLAGYYYLQTQVIANAAAALAEENNKGGADDNTSTALATTNFAADGEKRWQPSRLVPVLVRVLTDLPAERRSIIAVASTILTAAIEYGYVGHSSAVQQPSSPNDMTAASLSEVVMGNLGPTPTLRPIVRLSAAETIALISKLQAAGTDAQQSTLPNPPDGCCNPGSGMPSNGPTFVKSSRVCDDNPAMAYSDSGAVLAELSPRVNVTSLNAELRRAQREAGKPDPTDPNNNDYNDNPHASNEDETPGESPVEEAQPEMPNTHRNNAHASKPKVSTYTYNIRFEGDHDSDRDLFGIGFATLHGFKLLKAQPQDAAKIIRTNPKEFFVLNNTDRRGSTGTSNAPEGRGGGGGVPPPNFQFGDDLFQALLRQQLGMGPAGVNNNNNNNPPPPPPPASAITGIDTSNMASYDVAEQRLYRCNWYNQEKNIVFANGEQITLEYDGSKRTVSFFRNGMRLGKLYRNVGKGMDEKKKETNAERSPSPGAQNTNTDRALFGSGSNERPPSVSAERSTEYAEHEGEDEEEVFQLVPFIALYEMGLSAVVQHPLLSQYCIRAQRLAQSLLRTAPPQTISEALRDPVTQLFTLRTLGSDGDGKSLIRWVRTERVTTSGGGGDLSDARGQLDILLQLAQQGNDRDAHRRILQEIGNRRAPTEVRTVTTSRRSVKLEQVFDGSAEVLVAHNESDERKTSKVNLAMLSPDVTTRLQNSVWVTTGEVFGALVDILVENVVSVGNGKVSVLEPAHTIRALRLVFDALVNEDSATATGTSADANISSTIAGERNMEILNTLTQEQFTGFLSVLRLLTSIRFNTNETEMVSLYMKELNAERLQTWKVLGTLGSHWTANCRSDKAFGDPNKNPDRTTTLVQASDDLASRRAMLAELPMMGTPVVSEAPEQFPQADEENDEAAVSNEDVLAARTVDGIRCSRCNGNPWEASPTCAHTLPANDLELLCELTKHISESDKTTDSSTGESPKISIPATYVPLINSSWKTSNFELKFTSGDASEGTVSGTGSDNRGSFTFSGKIQGEYTAELRLRYAFVPIDGEADNANNDEHADNNEEGAEWACNACTFLNPQNARMCQICNTSRPGMSWQCPRCTYAHNGNDSNRCEACGHHAPNRGGGGDGERDNEKLVSICTVCKTKRKFATTARFQKKAQCPTCGNETEFVFTEEYRATVRLSVTPQGDQANVKFHLAGTSDQLKLQKEGPSAAELLQLVAGVGLKIADYARIPSEVLKNSPPNAPLLRSRAAGTNFVGVSTVYLASRIMSKVVPRIFSSMTAPATELINIISNITMNEEMFFESVFSQLTPDQHNAAINAFCALCLKEPTNTKVPMLPTARSFAALSARAQKGASSNKVLFGISWAALRGVWATSLREDLRSLLVNNVSITVDRVAEGSNLSPGSAVYYCAPTKAATVQRLGLLLSIRSHDPTMVRQDPTLSALFVAQEAYARMRDGTRPLPKVLRDNVIARAPTCVQLTGSQMVSNQHLVHGQARGSIGVSARDKGHHYFEIVIPEDFAMRGRSSVAIGWGTKNHELQGANTHVGLTNDSAGFDPSAQEVRMMGGQTQYLTPRPVVAGDIIGAMLDLQEGRMCWTLNGEELDWVSSAFGGTDVLYPYVSRNAGSQPVEIRIGNTEYLPEGYKDFSAMLMESRAMEDDASVTPKSLTFYTQLSQWVNELTNSGIGIDRIMEFSGSWIPQGLSALARMDTLKPFVTITGAPASTATNAAGNATIDLSVLKPYVQQLIGFSNLIVVAGGTTENITRHYAIVKGQIDAIRRMMLSSARAVAIEQILSMSLDRDGQLSFEVTIDRDRAKEAIQRGDIGQILSNSITGQFFEAVRSRNIYRRRNMFSVKLADASGKMAQDYGGVYRSMITAMSNELMYTREAGTSERQPPVVPLFRCNDHSSRFTVLPNPELLHSAHREKVSQLFIWLGRMFGNAVMAGTTVYSISLPILVWKKLLGQPVSIEEFYIDCNDSAKGSLEDDEFILSDDYLYSFPNIESHYHGPTDVQAYLASHGGALVGGIGAGGAAGLVMMMTPVSQATGAFPRVGSELGLFGREPSSTELSDLQMGSNQTSGQPHPTGSGNSAASALIAKRERLVAEVIKMRRDAAIKALLTEYDEAIAYIKKGLESVVPPEALREFTWEDLRRRVTGSLALTGEDILSNAELDTLPEDVREMFKAAVLSLTPDMCAKMLQYCTGQERLPVPEPIKVTCGDKPTHLPTAHTCSPISLTVHKYSNVDEMVEMLTKAISHSGEFGLV